MWLKVGPHLSAPISTMPILNVCFIWSTVSILDAEKDPIDKIFLV